MKWVEYSVAEMVLNSVGWKERLLVEWWVGWKVEMTVVMKGFLRAEQKALN
jgi:hypothetical protein